MMRDEYGGGWGWHPRGSRKRRRWRFPCGGRHRRGDRRGRPVWNARSPFVLPREGMSVLLADARITAVPVLGGDPFYVITSDV